VSKIITVVVLANNDKYENMINVYTSIRKEVRITYNNNYYCRSLYDKLRRASERRRRIIVNIIANNNQCLFAVIYIMMIWKRMVMMILTAAGR
jgi:hypothetical protein